MRGRRQKNYSYAGHCAKCSLEPSSSPPSRLAVPGPQSVVRKKPALTWAMSHPVSLPYELRPQLRTDKADLGRGNQPTRVVPRLFLQGLQSETGCFSLSSGPVHRLSLGCTCPPCRGAEFLRQLSSVCWSRIKVTFIFLAFLGLVAISANASTNTSRPKT